MQQQGTLDSAEGASTHQLPMTVAILFTLLSWAIVPVRRNVQSQLPTLLGEDTQSRMRSGSWW